MREAYYWLSPPWKVVVKIALILAVFDTVLLVASLIVAFS